MVIISKENSFGAWSFLIGIVIAILVGISTSLTPINFLAKYNPQIYAILVILGVLIGFVNIRNQTPDDSDTFLLTSAIVVVVSKFGMDSVRGSIIGIGIGTAVSSIFGALLALVVPSTIIVALGRVFSLTKV